MKKTLKRIGALALALCLVLALSATAFADDLTMTSGVAGAFNTTDKDASLTVDADKSISITKELTAYNPDASAVSAPVITYSYKIEAGPAGNTITDNPAVHDSNASSVVQAKAGIVPGIKLTGSINGSAGTESAAATGSDITGTIAWNNSGTLNTAADGLANTQTMKINFTDVAFTGAGVYRYKITQTVDSYDDSGVVKGTGEGTGDIVRYLDVYVKDGATAGSYDIYGYVCFKTVDDINYSDTSNVEKSNGFVDTDGTTGTSNADSYYTFNVELTKVLVGDQAMNNNQFPFSVTFANSTVTKDILLREEHSGTVTVPTLASKAISSYAFDGQAGTDGNKLAIAKDGKVKFIGIPAGTTLTIKEYNNVVGTTYKTKTENGTTNINPAVALAWDSWTSTITTVGGTANENSKVTADFTDDGTGSGKTVIFTNTLELISPTGVVFRVAPFMMILAAGIVLLVLSIRRRRLADDEA